MITLREPIATLPLILLCFLATGSFTPLPATAQTMQRLSLLSLTPYATADDTADVRITADSLSAVYHQTKSPALAMGLSALIPGAGQIYNGSYWKTPIIWGLGGWFVYEWLQLDKSYRDYLGKYSASVTPQDPSGDSRYLTIREFYRDERDGFAWYFGILYALNILDAYVDASLYDFNEHATVRFVSRPSGMALNLKITF